MNEAMNSGNDVGGAKLPSRSKEYQREWKRAQAAELLAQGKCTKCKEPRKLGDPCLVCQANCAAKKAKAVVFGNCTTGDHPNDRAPEYKTCSACAASESARYREARVEGRDGTTNWQAKRDAAGLCRICPVDNPNPRDPGKKTCSQCRLLAKRKRQAKQAAGICISCSKPRGDSKSSGYCQPCHEQQLARQPEYTRKKRERIIKAYGGKCQCPGGCDVTAFEFLHFDHVGGGGNEHRRQLRKENSTTFYNWIETEGYPSSVRLLCANCNSARGFYGECPHERLRREQQTANDEFLDTFAANHQDLVNAIK